MTTPLVCCIDCNDHPAEGDDAVWSTLVVSGINEFRHVPEGGVGLHPAITLLPTVQHARLRPQASGSVQPRKIRTEYGYRVHWIDTSGTLLMCGARDPVAAVNPMAGGVGDNETIVARTASRVGQNMPEWGWHILSKRVAMRAVHPV